MTTRSAPMETPQPTNKGGKDTRSSSKILSAAVDWLACTTPKSSVAAGWYEWFEEIQATNQTLRAPAQHMRRLGYSGLVLSDNTFLGKRSVEGDFLWISTGAAAHRDWECISGPAHNVTRLDLQVTMEFRRPRHRDVARDIYANRDLSRLQHTYYQSNGGSTCYVGSKASDYFGRVYDKSSAYDCPVGRVWRYEVVSKSKPNNARIVTLMQDAIADNALADYITGFVHAWFAERTARPGFDPKSEIAVVRETEATLGYPERQLRWLRTGVSPTVARLVRDGYWREAHEALGLVRETIPSWHAEVENDG